MLVGVFYGWWVVIACFIIAFYVAGATFYGFTAFFEPIVREFAWSYTHVSLASSLRGLEMGIMAPFVGFVVDRLGSRKVLLWGLIITGLGFILLSLTNSLIMFYCSFLLLSLGAGGCTSLVLMSVVADWFDKNLAKAMGIVACGIGAGGLIVPAIVWLVDTYQWRTTMVILGLGMWILGIPLSLVVRNKPEELGYLRDGEPLTKAKFVPGARENSAMEFQQILKSKDFWYINIAEAIRFLAISAVIVHVMPYLGSVGMQRHTASIVAASIPLLSIFGRLGFGWLADVYDNRRVLAFAFCLMALGMLAFSHARVFWLVFPFLFLLSPAYGGGMVLRGAIILHYFGRTSFSKLLGITMGSASVGGIIGPTLAGWTYDTTGSYYLIWLIFSGLLVLALALVLRTKPYKSES